MATLSVEFDGTTFLVAGAFGPEVAPVTETVSVESLPAATIAHLLRIGMTNVLRDSMAGKAGDDVEARQALVNKIGRVLGGDMSGSVRGPRVDAETRMRNEYVRGLIEAKIAPASRPKGAKAWADAIAQVYAANTRAVDAEVKRRLRAQPEIEITL